MLVFYREPDEELDVIQILMFFGEHLDTKTVTFLGAPRPYPMLCYMNVCLNDVVCGQGQINFLLTYLQVMKIS